ncbi:MAG TPA: hypothetical protein VF263_13525, partial [Longimicrobiaceae bacterium]
RRNGMQRKLKLSLDDLRVVTFETVSGPGRADGAVRALCDGDTGGACGECTECTACSACTACTTCPPPSP